MIYIELTDRLKYSSPRNKRTYITSDEIWAFTEQPETDKIDKDTNRISAHDLFNLFTAKIIEAKTRFVR